MGIPHIPVSNHGQIVQISTRWYYTVCYCNIISPPPPPPPLVSHSFSFFSSPRCQPLLPSLLPPSLSLLFLPPSPPRNGVLKVGDRILKVNGHDVSKASQLETLSLLKASAENCTLQIEYDVTVHGETTLSTPTQPLCSPTCRPHVYTRCIHTQSHIDKLHSLRQLYTEPCSHLLVVC